MQRSAAAFEAAGWSRQEVVNVPNALSMARLLSGPLIASWILDGQASLGGCWACSKGAAEHDRHARVLCLASSLATRFMQYTVSDSGSTVRDSTYCS